MADKLTCVRASAARADHKRATSGASCLTLALASATQALLAHGAQAAGFGLLDDDRWETEAMLLYYSEVDRVSALKPMIGVTRILDTDESVTVRLTVDSLTGASGTGAVPSVTPQTYTRPSGNGDYTVPAGDVPLDDTFHDTRVSLASHWVQGVREGDELTLGATASNEFDYQSFGLNAQFAHSYNDNNTTLSIGVAGSADTTDPVGGVPVAFQPMTAAGAVSGPRESSENKTVGDLLFGLTQVVDRQSFVQLNLGVSQVSGYQNDAYKYVSVVDVTGGVLEGTDGVPLAVHENRPDSRFKQTLHVRYKRDFSNRVFDSAYRLSTDDWGIDSHTLELSVRQPLGRGWLEPRLRLYRQSEADFYTPFLLEGEQPAAGSTASLASADYRLGAMNAYTLGLEYGRQGRHDWRIALEYYLQQNDRPDTFGALDGLDLTPDVSAVIFRIGTAF